MNKNIGLGIVLGFSGTLTLGSFIFSLKWAMQNLQIIPATCFICLWIIGVIGTAMVWTLAGDRLKQ